jgi:cytochrome c oxidase subunit 2
VYDNLHRWISNPDEVKPGNQMGKIDLTEQEIEGIAKYLSDLKLNYEQ